MKLRHTVLLGILGFSGAWHFDSLTFAYITALGCALLYSLRCIEYQLGDLKGRIAPKKQPTAYDQILAASFGRPLPEIETDTDSEGWEPVVAGATDLSLRNLLGTNPQTSAPIQMRKLSKNGWKYRSPTQKDIENYLTSEAW